MTITQEAKSLLDKVFETNGYDCLKASLQESCCGKSLVLSMAKLDDKDEPVTIDGVSVLMNNETKERAKSVTLTTRKGKLVLQDEATTGCC